jgi:hypothetical protein
MNRIVNSDGCLRPCSLYMNSDPWLEFKDWCQQRGTDPATDLDMTQKQISDIYQTPTWKLIESGFTNGDPAPLCKKHCSYSVLFPKRHKDLNSES